MQVGNINGENYTEIWQGGSGGRKEIVAYGNDCTVLVEHTFLWNYLVKFGIRQVSCQWIFEPQYRVLILWTGL